MCYWGIGCAFKCKFIFFFQAEDGIRDPLWSRELGDVYKRLLGPHAREPHTFESRALQPHALESPALEPHALGPRALRSPALESRALESHALEPHDLEPPAVESNALESHPLETHAPEADPYKQLTRATIISE